MGSRALLLSPYIPLLQDLLPRVLMDQKLSIRTQESQKSSSILSKGSVSLDTSYNKSKSAGGILG